VRQRSGNERDLSDARTRLERLGIDDAQIDDILASGQATTHLTIRSPIKGHVIRKYVREGQYVSEGSALYELAIYEEDMAFLPLSHTHKAGDWIQDALQGEGPFIKP